MPSHSARSRPGRWWRPWPRWATPPTASRAGLLAALVAFFPSFALVLVGGGQFARLRGNARAQAFLDGAGPAAIGAILGAAIPLAGALRVQWQVVVLGAAALALLVWQRGVVETLIAAGVLGALLDVAGLAVPH